MLSALSIRDVVLIERLDLDFDAGLTVLTGETGAGKSILLDSLGLALGARAEGAMVRAGAEQASVAAIFTLPPAHPARAFLAAQGVAQEVEIGAEIMLRRVVSREGRSRAFIDDQPVGVALLRGLGALLVEVQGQHEQMGLADPASHAALLDDFGAAWDLRDAVAEAWRRWRAALLDEAEAKAALAAAARDQDWLAHAEAELAALAPAPDEEAHLAGARQNLQQQAREAEALAMALAELAPRDRRHSGPAAALRASARAIERAARRQPSAEAAEETGAAEAASRADILAAIGRAEEAVAEAERLLEAALAALAVDPRQLEVAEERLFALRAAARKHQVTVAELPALLDDLRRRRASLAEGAARLEALAAAAAAARAAYLEAAARLAARRAEAARRLERAIARELAPLKFAAARFMVEITPLADSAFGAFGTEAVRFLIATNPGEAPGPLARIASGGEMSRLMLALKVVLARFSPARTLIFDEVDAGIGGATAAAVGERLARVADGLQVLVVTHSPQVAARGTRHLRVAKTLARGRASTVIEPLAGRARREEIARMLAGETITEAARAAADDLLGAA